LSIGFVSVRLLLSDEFDARSQFKF